MFKFRNWTERLLMDKASETPAGGATPPPAGNKEIEDLKTQNAELLKRLTALEGKTNPTPPPAAKPPEQDLAEKARLEREAQAKKDGDTKVLSSAIEFNYKAPEWFKNNASLLPKTIESIFAQAEKENYSTPIEKAEAIKVGIVSEFFAIQSNLDLLTDTQKNSVDEFKKLTKTDKQARVSELFSSIFEPAFEYSKKLERAKQMQQGGPIEGSDVQKNYVAKMTALSRKHYLKEK